MLSQASIDIKEANQTLAIIKSYAQPSRLYRYRSLEDFAREMDAIENAYLYCAPYKDLNDPMEGRYTSSRLLKKSSRYSAIRDAIAGKKARIGVCSFSEVFDHELMWAHYADHFRGICVAYSLSHLLRNLDDAVRFVRIYYDESAPTVGRSAHSDTWLAKMVLSHKNYRWLYEREWRMFANRGKMYYSNVACVTRVYLGSRMRPAQRSQIKDELGRLGIKTSEMLVDKYSISFGPKA